MCRVWNGDAVEQAACWERSSLCATVYSYVAAMLCVDLEVSLHVRSLPRREIAAIDIHRWPSSTWAAALRHPNPL